MYVMICWAILFLFLFSFGKATCSTAVLVFVSVMARCVDRGKVCLQWEVESICNGGLCQFALGGESICNGGLNQFAMGG